MENTPVTIETSYKPLTEWANEPKVTELQRDLLEALPSHNLHVTNVNRWLAALRAEIDFKPEEGRSKVQPKVIRKQYEWRYSALEEPFLSTEDLFKVNPATAQDVEAAKQNQLILNKQFRVDIPKTKFVNKFVRTAVNTGTSLVKLAWEEQTGIILEEQMRPVFASTPEEFLPFAQQLLASGQVDEPTIMQVIQSGQFRQIPIGEEPVTVQVEKKFINRPIIEVKDSRNAVIDPSCEGDLDKARFIIDKVLVDMSTLKQDGRYTNLDNIVGIDQSVTEFDSYEWDYRYRSDKNFQFQDKPRKKMVMYEYWGYWDTNGDGIVVPIVASWIGQTMIRLEENPYPDKKLPFVLCQYLPPDVNVSHGDSDAELIEDNQRIIGAVTRGMVDLLGRSANAQIGIRKDLLDPINLSRFKRGQHFEYNPVTSVDNAIFTTKMPEVPNSALQMIQYQSAEAEALSGVIPFGSAGGANPSTYKSATSVKSATSASARRELGILRRMADAFKDIGKKIISMNSVWLSDEEVIRVTDDNFIAIKRDDLAGDFDLRIDISTAEADNAKAEDLSFMLQTLGPALGDLGIIKMFASEIADLKKMPALAQAIRDYNPEPDPMAQAKLQAEIEYLQANTQKDLTAGQKNIADEVLKYAKAEEAGAKSRNISSQTDLTDLTYLEQSSGLNQDRLLEQIVTKEQAKPKPANSNN